MHRLRYKLLAAAACLASALTCAGVIAIARTSGSNSHVFLTWNLFLAWLPLAAAAAANRCMHSPLKLLALPAVALWLLFLPNAPYMLTDLVHYRSLNPHASPPLDLATLASAAVAGLSVGFLSLLLVEELVVASAGPLAGIAFAAFASCLSSFGIYLGRIVRLNSWDAANHPGRILTLVLQRFTDPLRHPLFVAGFALFSSFLFAGYLLWTALLHRYQRR